MFILQEFLVGVILPWWLPQDTRHNHSSVSVFSSGMLEGLKIMGGGGGKKYYSGRNFSPLPSSGGLTDLPKSPNLVPASLLSLGSSNELGI